MTQESVDRKQRKALHYDDVVALYSAGLSMLDIAQRVGLSKSTVRRWVGKPYIPPKPLPASKRRCDCGQLATHLDVSLQLGTGDGYISNELYDLCQDCYDLEQEPVNTYGENLLNR